MDDPNITIEEYIRLEEEKSCRRGKVYNWKAAKYGKIWYDEDIYNLISVETEFPAIVLKDSLTPEVTLSYEPTISPLNDNKINFRISFDKSDDEDYMVIYDKNSFSYKIIYVDDLITDSENDNDKVNMPSFPSPEPTPQYIDEFDLKDETSLSKCDEKEQNVLYFNDLFPFNIIFLDETSDKDNDDHEIDIKHSSGVKVTRSLPYSVLHPNPWLNSNEDVIEMYMSIPSLWPCMYDLTALLECLSLLLLILTTPSLIGARKFQEDGINWALLVAGSNEYENYRHQADVCHAYQILKRGGLKDENIMVFMYDDIANHRYNPKPGAFLMLFGITSVLIDVNAAQSKLVLQEKFNENYSKKPKRKDTQIPQSSGPTKHVANKAVYKELDDSLVRAATTTSSLEAEQDSGNIAKTKSKATPNESSSLGTTSGGGPRRQKTMGDTIAQTRFENVSKHSNDPLLTRGNTFQSGEDSLKLNELMELCTNLQTRVLDLEKTKIKQAEEIISLKTRVKKLEQKKRSITHGLKRLYKGRINAIDVDEDITLVNDQDDVNMFDVNTLTGDEVLAEQEIATKDVNLTVDEVTLAQAPAALKSVKPKVKANVVEDPSVPVSARQVQSYDCYTNNNLNCYNSNSKKRNSIRLQVGFDEEERLAREKNEANVALPEEWDDIQAKVDADYQLAQRLQAEEQEQFITKQKAALFKELLEQRKKHFAAKKAEENRNKPPTKAQQKKTMITYLKNMEGWKHKDLKSKYFDSIKELFDKAFKRVNMFVDYRTDLVEAKVDNDQEAAKIKELMKIIPDEEEVAIDVIPLATKPLTILDWKIHKEGKKNYYQIIRADRSLKIYLVFSHMLKSFDKEDFETLWKLVKAKYGSTRLVEDLDLILLGDLKTMFEPHVEDKVWRNQQDYRVLDWKLYDSCRVHSLRMQHMYIHMLVEKRYPLTSATITDMLNKKLHCDHLSKMAYQLLKLLIKQLKNQ
ncbi:uncharacterized mitochondrial protein-like protein [Tanacetum coccineum]